MEPTRPTPLRNTVQTPPAHAERGAGRTIALAALAISLTTPLWFDTALRLFGFTPSLHQSQRKDALAIGQQERKLQDLQQRLTAAGADLSRTQADLIRAEQTQASTATWTRNLILARLTESLRRGSAFMPEMAMARSAALQDGELAALIAVVEPYASIGVPTAETLAADFRRVTDPVLRPARGLNPFAWAAAVYGMLPFIRSATDPDPGRMALRDAAALVDSGRIREAAALLRPLSGPIRDLTAGWIADADARAAADTLDQRVAALLTGFKG